MTLGIEMSAPGAGIESGRATRDAGAVLVRRGWSSESTACAPKIAALAALATLPPPEAVPRVTYESRGNLLIVAGTAPERAWRCAESLAPSLAVTLLEGAPSGRPAPCAVWSGRIAGVSGHLGEFSVTLEGLARQGSAPAAGPAPARFDLILDFSEPALFAMRQPPQGYFRAPAIAALLEPMLEELGSAVGEFEKPRYFHYRENICAHSRSQVTGCDACIEICSTQAIAPDRDHVKVDPHLCMGCGACATVCP